MIDITEIPFNRIDGNTTNLREFTGCVVLAVNVASKCGLTPQYEGLEKLYEEFRDQGFVVLGFPANNFKEQEPGSNAEIIEFCTYTYGVQFPLAEKISVKGDDIHPLYRELTAIEPQAVGLGPDNALLKRLTEIGCAPEKESDVLWNFEKFLINRSGAVVARFAPNIAPQDERIVSAIKKCLAS